MFPTTIAGSLPKPSWLAEPDKLWPQWRLERRRSRRRQARRDAAGAEASGRRRHRHRQRRRAVAAAFRARLSRIRRRHRLRQQGRDGNPQRPLQGDGADRDRRRSSSGAACTGPRRRFARAHTARKLKITMPGPMTIIDTIADKHYGDRVKMAFAFADLLNQEVARARGRRRRRDPVRRAGVQRLHEGGFGLGHRGAASRDRRPQVQDRRAHLLRLRHQGQYRLEGHARRRVAAIRGDVPGARGKPHLPRSRSNASTPRCRSNCWRCSRARTCRSASSMWRATRSRRRRRSRPPSRPR